jgi:hypothetical protein
MKKRFLSLALATAVSALAHHGYSEYDRDARVSLEGTVKNVVWGNPHVLITLQTENQGEYTVEWGSVLQLTGWGIKANPIKQGDHVIVTGSVNKNPEKHILTLVFEMSRPADGWRWADPRKTNVK